MKKFLLILSIFISFFSINFVYSAEVNVLESYTELRSIDEGTFNEYRYKLSKQYFNLRNSMEIDGKMSSQVLNEMISLANTGYKYLFNNLKNDNYLNYLVTSLGKGLKTPNNKSNYAEIVKRLSDFIEKVDIKAIKGSIEAIPKEGNAPLSVTLRGKVKDPTGTKIPLYNYTWWIDTGSEKEVIGTEPFLNHTFTEEGSFSVFLDVVSNHKNSNGFTDVLPFREKVTISVNEKVASLILKVNGISIEDQDNIKFTPSESSYGLIFDATSSTPTSGAKFIETSWDFGNGVTKKYKGSPRVERVIYSREGEYDVKLNLLTNELKQVKVAFTISIHNLIATINASEEEGNIGDKFYFSARPSGNKKGLSYSWEILDIKGDKTIYRKSGKSISHTFLSKGKFNVRLNVIDSSGNSDVDTRIINIKSRPPVANLKYSIPEKNKPNTVLLDASKSYDPDFSDEGKLKYTWYIDGEKVNLEDPNSSGSMGYHTFDSIGTHTIGLEVKDLDGMLTKQRIRANITSILSVDFFTFPRAIQRNGYIKFMAQSPEADVFEWNFGDGIKKGGRLSKITHIYDKSGTFNVTLKVIDKKGNTNTYTKVVYVGESDNPLALINTSIEGGKGEISFDGEACNGKGAYILNRVNAVKFDAKDSINIDGKNDGLEYSWKIGKSKYSSSMSVNNKFDELGCFNVKLTVKSKNNSKTNIKEIMVDVRNFKPILNSLSLDVTNPGGDPLVVNVSAIGTKDEDGVIQSYLWYYYTELDNEPQDLRATTKADTTFVIPKVSGNYYFVVILKDNNEDRTFSEEITDSRYFITVTGDNLNTPLVELKVNNSSIAIGDEVIFTANVKNILGQDIKEGSTFSWDFDGDGFYEKEIKGKNVVNYKFKKSGKFHSKVKVKYKGMSNTRNVSVNVLNRFYPEFDYISIGSKFIFLNKSTGKIDANHWDLGDGTKITSTNFTYTYKDKKTSHNVKLNISEGTKTKSITKKVVKNIKNKIKAHKKGLNIFSYPEISKSGSIILKDSGEKVFIYIGESKGDIEKYIVDFDIEIDSSLNGGKDNDEDNKGTASYESGDVLSVDLNQKRKQTIRVFLKDKNGDVIESQDIDIIKEYIEENEINLDNIKFEGIKDSDREVIKKLKDLVRGLSSEHRLKSSEYIQKLQDEWFDNTEKTRVIIEFETYLNGNNIETSDEIIEILESLLVEGQEDKSEKNKAFNALKNLLPSSIFCNNIGEFNNCHKFLINKLEKINASEDIENNKKLGTEILDVVKVSNNMTPKQKTDFKAILKSLIYGGFQNIPDSEVKEVKDEDKETDNSGFSFIGLIVSIFYWLGIFILVFIGIIGVYFIYYKISNKDDDLGFVDFIMKKTSLNKQNNESIIDDTKEDILGVVETKKIEKKDDIIKTKSGVFSGNTDLEKQNSNKKIETKQEIKEEKDKIKLEDNKKEKGEIPDWLAGSFGSGSKETETKTKKQIETKKQEGGKKDDKFVSKDLNKSPKIQKQEIKKTKEKQEDLNKVISIEENNVPDWLKKDAFNDKKSSIKQKKEIKEDDKNNDIIKEKIPDWLTGSLDNKKDIKQTSDKKLVKEIDTKSTKEEVDNKKLLEEKSISSTKKEEIPKISIGKKIVKKEENKQEKLNSVMDKKNNNKIETSKIVKKEENKEEKKTDKKGSSGELWDDGMDVPDWLKSGDKK